MTDTDGDNFLSNYKKIRLQLQQDIKDELFIDDNPSFIQVDKVLKTVNNSTNKFYFYFKFVLVNLIYVMTTIFNNICSCIVNKFIPFIISICKNVRIYLNNKFVPFLMTILKSTGGFIVNHFFPFATSIINVIVDKIGSYIPTIRYFATEYVIGIIIIGLILSTFLFLFNIQAST